MNFVSREDREGGEGQKFALVLLRVLRATNCFCFRASPFNLPDANGLETV
jgi:hypothetical protein